jgi:DNA-binding transcriptional MerR regulator
MSAQPAREYLGIGEVLTRLRGEFPDISVSKIRFLESEGLIEPARSPSGYRRFDAADVERLRYILTAQRDQYLPLRVIKERLSPSASGSGRAHGDGAAAVGGGALSRRELLAAAGIDDAQLAELETFGLLSRAGRAYGRSALQVACAAAVLGRYGVEARHLRAVRAAVDREISFIEQVVAPTLRQRKPEAREQAARTAREIAALTLRLHAALVEAALAEAGFAGDGLAEPGDGGHNAAETSASGGLALGGAVAGGSCAEGEAAQERRYQPGRASGVGRDSGIRGASA